VIVTVTPSPSIDWTVSVDPFTLGAVNRATDSVREPSGKGVNVSIALHRGGIETRAIFPAGGVTGQFMSTALSEQGVPFVLIDTGADIRTNITLMTPDHTGTKINEPGSPLSGEVMAQLRDVVQDAAGAATAVLTCGSLPSGVAPSFHRDIIELANRLGVYSVVDASGESLSLALEANPNLIKPNVHELAELAGASITTLGEVVSATQLIRDRGAGAVLASLGGDGVMYVDELGALYAKAIGIPVANAVGAGDALLAGFMGGGPDREGRLANAVLWASSAVAHPSTLFSVRPDFAAFITVGPVNDPQVALGEPSEQLGRIL
jgi:1-phosphofructokinase